MEHQLAITYGPRADQQMGDEVQVMAQIDLRSFEDDGYPDEITGKLLELPKVLLQRVQEGKAVHVDLGGKTYTFGSLSDRGEFQLRRDRAAEGGAAGSAP